MFGSELSPDAYDKMSGDEQKSQASDDANTLKAHAAIKAHPPRHAAARDTLQSQQNAGKQALNHSNRSLRNKVKSGLGKAFPKDKTANTPFNKAGKGETPFDKSSEDK